MKNINHKKDPRSIFFDERAHNWEEHCYPAHARKRLQELVPCFGVKTGTTVLDLGAGTGVLAPYLRKLLGPDGTLISMDVSFEMAKLAAKKKDYFKGAVVQATAMYLPFSPSSADTVVCFAAFPHFSNKQKALSEIWRVLKPGGNIVIAHLLSRLELEKHHGSKSAVANDKLPDDASMLNLLEQTGFSNISLLDIPGRYLAKAIKRI